MQAAQNKGGRIMKSTTIMLGSALMLAATGITGCATAMPDAQHTARISRTQQAGDLAFHYRRQAMDLRDLARRYELEATALAAMKGVEHQETLRSRELAKTFWAAADDADQTAREYRRQLPHNRLY
jgi:hypothetical protein